MQRMYANIKLPVDVYSDGKFKMLYDQMEISMVNELPPEVVTELKEEVMERLQEQESKLDEETEDIKIYASDYPFHRNKKRWNTTFRKNTKRNQLTKKNYIDISTNI
jgi:hypothetical protein